MNRRFVLALGLVVCTGCVARVIKREPTGGPRTALPNGAPERAQLVVGRIGRESGSHDGIAYVVLTFASGQRSSFMMPNLLDVTFEVPARERVKVEYFVAGCMWFAPCEPPEVPRGIGSAHHCKTWISAEPGSVVHLMANFSPFRRLCRFESITPVEMPSLYDRQDTKLEAVFERGRPPSDYPLTARLRYDNGWLLTGWLTSARIPAEVLGFRRKVNLHKSRQAVLLHVRTNSGIEEFHPVTLEDHALNRLMVAPRDPAAASRRIEEDELGKKVVPVPHEVAPTPTPVDEVAIPLQF